MGITECEIHGMSAILPICQELKDDLSHDNTPREIIAIWTKLDPSEEGGAAMVMPEESCVRRLCVSQLPAAGSTSQEVSLSERRVKVI